MKLRSHLEILVWLQGDMQRYLPHDILLTAWGNFRSGNIQHDIVSIVTGLRSDMANDFIVTPLLMRLYAQWLEQGKKAFVHAGNGLGTLLGPGRLHREEQREQPRAQAVAVLSHSAQCN